MSRFIFSALCAFFVCSICSTVASASDSAAGKALYDSKSCMACHNTGLSGAPKLGDKKAWEPRIAQGVDLLVSHAVNGFAGSAGTMPAKGDDATLTDAQIGDIVAYMVEKAK